MSILGLSSQLTGKDIMREFLSSIVVFLIALPLCLGIAVACEVPPALGLITGIVGGLLAGRLAGAPLQVSGPAAGLTVLVYELVERHGLEALGPVVLMAGTLQVAAGVFKLGRWFRAVSPAVIHGMLAGIGILIMISQFHVMFDAQPHGSGLPNIVHIPRTVSHVLSGGGGHWAVFIGMVTLMILSLWKHLNLEKHTRIPGPLPAIAVATLLSTFGMLPVKHISVPNNLLNALNVPTADSFTGLLDSPLLLSALALALIASAETLLSAAAVDKLQSGPRANFNAELIAQGCGNMLCGALGALPMTGVIVRSKVNVEAGAKTRLSTMLHGCWLLLAVVSIPGILQLVPTASLAALLIFTGYKLVDGEVIRQLRSYGKAELAIYVSTVSMIVTTDLLTGVLVGLLLSMVKLVWTIAQLHVSVTAAPGSNNYTLTLAGAATFLSLPNLSETLEKVPSGCTLQVDYQNLSYIDHSCLELLRGWETRHNLTGGKLVADWDALVARYHAPAGICS